VRRSLTISSSAAAAERAIVLHDRIEAARPRRPNARARQARGLWTRLRTAWLSRRNFPRRPSSQDDQDAADAGRRKGNP
jgi:hypothetical protein